MAVVMDAPPTAPLVSDGRSRADARQARRWPAALHTGVEIDGRYRLGEVIGTGGAGSVYRARDLRIGRPVAVKVLHPHLSDDSATVERFRCEARCAAQLQDRHVPSVYDLGEWAGIHFMTMEYVSGVPLSAVIREEAPLDPARAVDLIAQMLRAARSIHARGIVHRDLKPANAIVDRRGCVKVVDFGIARLPRKHLTEAGPILGTACYASPEQVEGREVTAASDLYSIGVILYELLAGRPPFEAEWALALALMHVKDPPRPLTAARPAIAPRLAATVMRSLDKDPSGRFADADHFIAALEGACR